MNPTGPACTDATSEAEKAGSGERFWMWESIQERMTVRAESGLSGESGARFFTVEI